MSENKRCCLGAEIPGYGHSRNCKGGGITDLKSMGLIAITETAYDKLLAERDELLDALEDLSFFSSCSACDENHKIRDEALEKLK